MSPEQARGEPLDTRTDLFSFGSVLYEMATGRPAFTGNTAAVVFSAILEKEPVAPGQLNAGLPPQLEPILAKALEKDRMLRYQSAADLRADLERLRRDLSSGRSAPTVRRPALSPSGRRVTAGLAGVALLALLVAAAWYFVIRPERRADPIDSVAVLPFVNENGDAEVDYLSDGLTDSLINALTQVQGLRVVPRSTMFRYKNQKVDPQTIGRELGVRAILSGSVAQRGERLVVRADLVDMSLQSQVWGNVYDGTMPGMLGIRTEIA
jgi:TolB-like protein